MIILHEFTIDILLKSKSILEYTTSTKQINIVFNKHEFFFAKLQFVNFLFSKSGHSNDNFK